MAFTTPGQLTAQQAEISRLNTILTEKVRDKKKLQQVRDDEVAAAQAIFVAARDRADADYKTAVGDTDTVLDDIQAKLNGETTLDAEK